MEQKVIPLILAGGKGSRFWPLSREKCPKQFLHLNGGETLLQKTLERAKVIAKNAVPYIIAGMDLYPLVESSLKGKDGVDYHFIGEPCGKNTAAAIYYGCRSVYQSEGDAVFVILPADHFIGETDLFAEDVRSAVTLAAEKDGIVLFGVRPHYAATGFGYAEVGRCREDEAGSYYRVRHFTEKPEKERAKRYLKKGNYYWNAGIFVLSFEKLCEVYEKHLPEMVSVLDSFLGGSEQDFGDGYEKLNAVSFDKAVLEKEQRVFLVSASFRWDDIGSFRGLSSIIPTDEKSNVCSGNLFLKDVSDSVVLTDNPLTAVIGVKDLIVVEDHGVLLICPMDRAQDIAMIPNSLNEKNMLYR